MDSTQNKKADKNFHSYPLLICYQLLFYNHLSCVYAHIATDTVEIHACRQILTIKFKFTTFDFMETAQCFTAQVNNFQT